MSEIKIWTEATGATTRILSLCFFIMLFAYISYSLSSRVKFVYSCVSSDINTAVIAFTNILIISLIVVMFYIRIAYGSPNVYGVDRFYYWTNIAPQWGDYAKFILQQLSMLLGLMYVIREKKYYICLFIMSIASQFIVGEKFTGLYLSLIFFFIPIVLINGTNLWDKLTSKKIIFSFLAAAALLIFSAFISYASLSSGVDATAKLVDRVVLQAQMWWAVDFFSPGHVATFDNIISHFFGFGVKENEMGIRYLMKMISPGDVYTIFMNRGITFTNGSPANLIFFFGYPLCLIPAAFLGVILGLTFRVLYEAIRSTDLILSVVAIKLFYVMIRVITMGDVDQLFDIKTILCIIIFICYSLLSALIERNGKFKKHMN
ncbi:DUF6418 domain-containing protein [Serratia fonticola]|uniref:DUF6418 domain-containing protein n=1 Tax=Serratia fonticola TaxID=47917 RepID=UPI001267F52F|nr:DUF6418 domain-containing protein [Serratia fonticola]